MPNQPDLMTQLLISAGAMAASVFLHVLFVSAAAAVYRSATPPAGGAMRFVRDVIVLVVLSLWLLMAHLIEIGLWADIFHRLNHFEDFETALYFSAVSYTTLGFGDILLPNEWRLLSGACAACGLLLFGLSAALLFDVTAKLRMGGGRN